MIEKLAEVCRSTRETENISMQTVADRAGREVSAVSRFERTGAIPRNLEGLVAAYAELAGVTPVSIWHRSLEAYGRKFGEDPVPNGDIGAIVERLQQMHERLAGRVIGGSYDDAMLDLIFAHAPLGLAQIDPNLRFVRVNERLAEIDGRNIAEHFQMEIRECARALTPYVALALTGERVLEEECEVRDHVCRVSCFPLNIQGEIMGALLIVVDVTFAKRMAEMWSNVGLAGNSAVNDGVG